MAPSRRIGKYEIVRRLGQGGMGSVYLGRDPDLDRPVALKMMRDVWPDEALRARFLREARAAASLRHANIVTIYDVGEHEDEPFIAMEYVSGETLANVIRRAGTVPLTRKLRILEQICAGLHFAHRAGILHRDVKPANIMIDVNDLVRILDFGIARTLDTSMTLQGAVMGSLNYMSPEQLNAGPIDHRADVFSVGAVAYELISGRLAFGGRIEDGVVQRLANEKPPALSSLVIDLDAEIDSIVGRALEKDPARRYPTMEDMESDLGRARSRAASGAAVKTIRITPCESTQVVPASALPPTEAALYAATRVSRTPTLEPVTVTKAVAVEELQPPLKTAKLRVLARPVVRWRAAAAAAAFIMAGAAAIWRLPGDSNPPPPPPSTADTPGNAGIVAGRVAVLRSAAREAWQRGDREPALSNVAAALALQPDDADTRTLVDDFVRQARERSASAAADARARQAQSTSMYSAALGRESEGVRLDGLGRSAEAARLFADAADLFARASAERLTPPPPAQSVPSPSPQPQPPAKPTVSNTSRPNTAGRDLIAPGAMGTLRVICDRNCSISIDGESRGILTASQGMPFPVVLGQHLVSVSGDGVAWEQIIEVNDPIQVLVRTNLNSALEKIQEEQRLALGAERQRQEAARREQERLARLAEEQRLEQLRREEEARQEAIRRAAEEERQRLAEIARREAAVRFFAAIAGIWQRTAETQQDPQSRTRIEDVVTIGANGAGVLDRTIIAEKYGFTGWRRTGRDTALYEFQCDGNGVMSGGFSGRIVLTNSNTLTISDAPYTRK